jgi:hypothetical protein
VDRCNGDPLRDARLPNAGVPENEDVFVSLDEPASQEFENQSTVDGRIEVPVNPADPSHSAHKPSFVTIAYRPARLPKTSYYCNSVVCQRTGSPSPVAGKHC